MFYQLKDRLNRWKFDRVARAILKTPALSMQEEAEVSVLTQLQHKDLLMFLVALKSFANQIPLRKVFILSDGSLTATDKSTLSKHIQAVEFLELNDVSNKHCPQGGCWERLLAIAERVSDHYLIQLDSDTLTLGSIEEVANLVRNNRSFVIGTWDNQTIEPMKTCSKRVIKNVNPQPDAHVQMVAEAAFLKLDDCENLNYVRGCAGFSGFSKGSFSPKTVEDFSRNMEALIGSKWHEWGAEQTMSNVIIANTPEAAVLPHPKYCDCTKIDSQKTNFIHFVGSCRFSTNKYANTASIAINMLNKKDVL